MKAYKDRFAKLSLSSIAQANENKGVMQLDISPVWNCLKICGKIVTAEISPEESILPESILEKVNDSILVVSTDHFEASFADEIFMCKLKKAGAIGLITDGTVRNIHNIEAISLPVFAQGVCDRVMGGNKMANTNVSIICSGVLCHAGDVAFADSDGVVVVEEGKVDAVLTLAEKIEAKKQKMLTT